MTRTLAVAHRGDPVGYRENTLVAFNAAVEQGADMVELDCRLTRDGRVVVLHDESLLRLWGLDAPVVATPWASVAALGDGAVRVPLLIQVLEELDVSLMIDVGSSEVMGAAYAEVRSAGAVERCLFVGELEALRLLRRSDQQARIGLTWDIAERPEPALLGELAPELFNPNAQLVDRALVEAFHRRHIGVSTWTVDDEREMVDLIGLGVDAIVTNRIATLVSVTRAGPGKETPAGAGNGGGEWEGGGEWRQPCSRRRSGALSEHELEECVALASELAASAVAELASQRVGPGDRTLKADSGEIVTRFDLAVEQRTRARLARAFPEHAVVGEEEGTSGDIAASRAVWYLDPIDGTSNFARGLPWSSFSLAVADEEGLAGGVVADLHRGSIFSARRDRGAALDSLGIRCRGGTGLEGGLLLGELAGEVPWPGLPELIVALGRRACGLRLMGSSALSLVSVAAGRADAALLGASDPIDVAAGVLIAREAGALVVAGTDAHRLLTAGAGDVARLPIGGGLLVAASERVRDELLDVLQEVLL